MLRSSTKQITEPGNVWVCEHGCGVLVNLAVNDANKVTIAAAGAIPIFLKAITARTGHVDVNEKGCLALAYIAANEANKIIIAAAGACGSDSGHPEGHDSPCRPCRCE